MRKLVSIVVLCGVISSINIHCNTTQNKMLIATTAVVIANVANGLLLYAKNNYFPETFKVFLETYKIDVAVVTGSNALAAVIVKKYLSKNEAFRRWFVEMTASLAQAKFDLNDGGDQEKVGQDLDTILRELNTIKAKSNDPVASGAIKELRRKANKYQNEAKAQSAPDKRTVGVPTAL